MTASHTRSQGIGVVLAAVAAAASQEAQEDAQGAVDGSGGASARGEVLPGAPPGQHCLHWQEGDGDCCRCGLANWCPDDGVPAHMTDEQITARWPVTGCPGAHRG